MKKKMIFGGCIAILVLAIIVPIFIDYCILGNSINSNVENDVWMAFFGSYFGGLFGAFATMAGVCFTFLDSEKKRKQEEIQRKQEQSTQWRLSIMPYLQSREKAIPKKIPLCTDENSYFIFLKNGKVFQKRDISGMTELGYDNNFIIEAELRNVGMGSAVSLNAFMNGQKFIFNDSLGKNQVLKVFYIFNMDELNYQEINIVFEYCDTMGMTKYRQEESFLIYLTSSQLQWEHKKYLSMPSILD